MTNSAVNLRMLIAYAIIIPVAVVVGYLLTNPLDYGTLGFLCLILALVVSPIFIKWHYPIMVFGLACPMTCFFLIGQPPLSQVVVLMSLGIAIVERTLNSDRRFISAPLVTWPLLFICAMTLLTAKLTGGIHLHTLGGGNEDYAGGGRKYIALLVGVAIYFALTSRVIPRDKWKFYLMLYLLPTFLGVISDLYFYLPSPLNYINLLFPPSSNVEPGESFEMIRFRATAFAASAVPVYLLARYGLRGVFMEGKLWRPALFLVFFAVSLLGGFRNVFGYLGLIMVLMFFLEGLHRTRLMPALLLLGVVGSLVLAVFSDKLPYTIQRSMCFLPLKWRTDVVLDAESSSEWRYRIWRDTWPKVPNHLLLGKGYTLSQEDYQGIGQGTFANFSASHIDASDESLALSMDYHSGPLSTLMPFGIWGGIGMLWLMVAVLVVVYRNYRYGDAELHTFNTYMLAQVISSIIFFLFIFGAFQNDVGGFAKFAGFSLAMNWGMAKAPQRVAADSLTSAKSLPASAPQPV
jgi:hypothetical protein